MVCMTAAFRGLLWVSNYCQLTFFCCTQHTHNVFFILSHTLTSTVFPPCLEFEFEYSNACKQSGILCVPLENIV